MWCFRLGFQYASLVLLTAGVLTAAPPASSGSSAGPAQSWIADNGNGTYSNPLFYEEFEDPDVIRVGEDYYLAGTTMHMNPGLMVMHSKDLVNWKLASYCIDRLDLGPAYPPEGRGHLRPRHLGACIRYHDGMFYVFSNVNGAGSRCSARSRLTALGIVTNSLECMIYPSYSTTMARSYHLRRGRAHRSTNSTRTSPDSS